MYEFLWFLFYYFVCTSILIIIGVFVYKYILNNKNVLLNKQAEKQLDDFWNNYDKEQNNNTNESNNININELITLLNTEIKNKEQKMIILIFKGG